MKLLFSSDRPNRPVPFSIEYSMEENAVMGKHVHNSSFFVFFFHILALLALLRPGIVVGATFSVLNYIVQTSIT